MGDRAHATALFNQGVETAKNLAYPDSLRHAYKCFASACYADPTWWRAFYQAGNNNADQKLQHSALACYRRALECESEPLERAKILSNICWQLQDMGQTAEALDTVSQALAIDPTLASAHINASMCYRDMSDSKKSLTHAQEAFRLDSGLNPEVALAFAYLFDRQFSKGFRHFEKRFEWRLQHFTNFPYPQWHGEEGKIVFLIADQGLGDTLSYARFVRKACLRASYVHIMCQHELLRLFQHAFFDIKNLNIIPGLSGNFPAADAWTTFVSLPDALGLSDEEIVNTPQIKSPTYSLPKSWKVPDRKLHVGIAWSGSPQNDIDRHRNIPVTEFFELYRVPGVQLYSLQVDANKQRIFDAGGAPVVHDLSPYITDIVTTVSLLQDLDLVITVESALGHICAMAEQECWLPYSYLGRDYRIGLTGEDMIWTPKHRIFPQAQGESWGAAFDRIVTALEERLRGSSGNGA